MVKAKINVSAPSEGKTRSIKLLSGSSMIGGAQDLMISQKKAFEYILGFFHEMSRCIFVKPGFGGAGKPFSAQPSPIFQG